MKVASTERCRDAFATTTARLSTTPHMSGYGDVHTDTIDGYWGLLKRGVIGTYHQISVKHLNRYLGEFQFKWNHRKA